MEVTCHPLACFQTGCAGILKRHCDRSKGRWPSRRHVKSIVAGLCSRNSRNSVGPSFSPYLLTSASAFLFPALALAEPVLEASAPALPTPEQLLVPLSEAGAEGGEPSPLLLGAAALGGASLLYAAVRAAAYFRLQYTAAEVLTRYVPKTASRVLDLNVASGRHLFYLPSSVSTVVGFNPTLDPQVVRAQGVSAGIELDLPGSPTKVSGSMGMAVETALKAIQKMPASSFDAVISIGGAFAGLEQGSSDTAAAQAKLSALLQQINRVLKPGGPFVFLEKAGPSRDDRPVFFISEKDAELFGKVNFDYSLEWIDRHVVGVAITEP